MLVSVVKLLFYNKEKFSNTSHCHQTGKKTCFWSCKADKLTIPNPFQKFTFSNNRG